MFAFIITTLICKYSNCIANRSEKDCNFITRILIVAIGLSVTFGLIWVFVYLATRNEISAPVELFQTIFIIIVASQGVLVFIIHGTCNPEIQEYWKKLFFSPSRKTRRVCVLAQSTTNSSASRPAMTDVLTNHSIKTVDTTMEVDLKPNQAYGDINHLHSRKVDANIDFKQNPAYGEIKGDVEYETVQPVEKCIPEYETIDYYY